MQAMTEELKQSRDEAATAVLAERNAAAAAVLAERDASAAAAYKERDAATEAIRAESEKTAEEREKMMEARNEERERGQRQRKMLEESWATEREAWTREREGWAKERVDLERQRRYWGIKEKLWQESFERMRQTYIESLWDAGETRIYKPVRSEFALSGEWSSLALELFFRGRIGKNQTRQSTQSTYRLINGLTRTINIADGKSERTHKSACFRPCRDPCMGHPCRAPRVIQRPRMSHIV